MQNPIRRRLLLTFALLAGAPLLSRAAEPSPSQPFELDDKVEIAGLFIGGKQVVVNRAKLFGGKSGAGVVFGTSSTGGSLTGLAPVNATQNFKATAQVTPGASDSGIDSGW